MMAEMKWLATDFAEERKRHAKWRKLVNKGVLAVAKEKEQEKSERERWMWSGVVSCRKWFVSREKWRSTSANTF